MSIRKSTLFIFLIYLCALLNSVHAQGFGFQKQTEAHFHANDSSHKHHTHQHEFDPSTLHQHSIVNTFLGARASTNTANKVTEALAISEAPAIANQTNSSNCGATGNDGEGCAEIVDAQHLVAGQKERFTVRFQAGATGIPVGGGISIGFHHGSSWAIQVVSPINHAGFVKVDSSNASNFSLEWKNYPPNGMLSNTPSINSDWIFHKVLIAKVINNAILPGEIVDFVFGANNKKIVIQRYVDPDHELRVTTDIDANGTYKGILRSPVIEIIHAAGSSLSATIPSQAMTGQLIDILIRLEDSNYNIVKNYEGHVNIVDEYGQIVGDNIEIINGIGNSQISIESVGAHRLRIASIDGLYEGRSNPVRVYNELPKKRLYWGDLHGHTNVSDGLGRDANEYFKFGRDVAALDFIALTDHGHFDWPANIQAVKDFYEPGKYVTLLAQEGGPGPNHMNIYYRRDDTAHIATWPSDYKSFMEDTFNQFNFNAQQPEAMTAPHHFAYETGSSGDPQYPFGIWDTRIARFIEVYSSHGTNEFPGNPRPLGLPSSDPALYMQDALSKGLKFGVIAASDNHDSRPGRSIWGAYPNGLAGVWADDLTRNSIWNSLWDYSTYGTSIDRIYMEFYANSHAMGSDIETNGNGAVTLTGYVIGKTDSVKLDLIKNNEEIQTYNTDTGLVEFSFDDEPGTGQHYYYLRATQENGERAWSTPIWVNVVDSPATQTQAYSDQIPASVSFKVPAEPFQTLRSGNTLLEGTASDMGGSGVKDVTLALYNWDIEQWVNASGEEQTWLEMQANLIAIDSQSGKWHLAINLPAGKYRVFARSTDNAGNISLNDEGNLDWDSLPFTVAQNSNLDTVAPKVTITTPASEHQAMSNIFSLEGNFLDTGGSGIKEVEVLIYSSELKQWTDLNGGAIDWHQHQASLIKTDAHSGSWYLPVQLPTGQYHSFARGIDNAGNYLLDDKGNARWSVVAFSVDTQSVSNGVIPSITITYPSIEFEQLQQFQQLEGRFSDNDGPSVMNVLVGLYSKDKESWIDSEGNPVVWQELNASLIATDTGSGTWHLPIKLPEGNYRIFTRAVNSNGDHAQEPDGNPSWTSRPFSVAISTIADTSVPTLTMSEPAFNGQRLATAPILQGTVNDSGGSGVKEVVIAIYNAVEAAWSDISGNDVEWLEYRAQLNYSDPHTANWSLTTALPTGSYIVFVRAVDHSNNIELNEDNNTRWMSIVFSID